MNNKLISIIFPFYSVDQNFEETIASIARQVYQNFDLILVAPKTLDYDSIRIKLKGFPVPIIFLNDSGSGIYSAMNDGIRASTGSYLYFIGSGDLLFCESTLLRIQSILQSNIDILLAQVYTNTNTLFPPPSNQQWINFKKGRWCSHQGVFMKRELIIKNGGFNIKYDVAADFDLLLRSIIQGADYKFEPLPVAYYKGGGYSDQKPGLNQVSMALFNSGLIRNAILFFCIEWLARLYRKFKYNYIIKTLHPTSSKFEN